MKNTIASCFAVIAVVVAFCPFVANAYPDFIGYGYTTCATCHYNTHGNGPLTDYGRALFSQEIAARSFWLSDEVTDEQAAELSGFLGATPLPPRFRPHAKYRGLWLQTNPGSANPRERYIHMQRDVGAVVAFDDDHRTIFSFTVGLLDRPRDYYGYGSQEEVVSREHYFRFYPTDKLLAAVGLMDLIYGIRIADHTSVSRQGIGISQDDQVHGVMLQWQDKEWDVALQVFAGNLLEASANRQSGVAVQGEYTILENDRVGASFLQMSNETTESRRIAIHNRWGLPDAHGSSLIAELGFKQDKVKDGPSTPTGTYGLFRGLINLKRGYNLFSTIERSQAEIKFSSPEIQRWTFGFLIFPWSRTEFRMMGVQTKTFSPAAAVDDVWQLQGQVHVSL